MPTRKKKGRPKDPKVTNLLEHIQPNFVEGGAKSIRRADVESVAAHADELRDAFSKGALSRHREEGELLVSLVEDHLSGSYPQASYWTVAVAAFALQYVLKPIDIIPDALPVVGHLDDAVVVSVSLSLIPRGLEDYRQWRLAHPS